MDNAVNGLLASTTFVRGINDCGFRLVISSCPRPLNFLYAATQDKVSHVPTKPEAPVITSGLLTISSRSEAEFSLISSRSEKICSVMC